MSTRKVRADSPNPIIAQPTEKPLSELTYDNRFAHNFCNCCEDVRLCCTATFCLPCLICCLYADAKEGWCSGCWQCFSMMFPVLYPFTFFCCSNISMLRTKIRASYKLHGSVIEDIYYTGLCPCCAAIQMKQELRVQGEIFD